MILPLELDDYETVFVVVFVFYYGVIEASFTHRRSAGSMDAISFSSALKAVASSAVDIWSSSWRCGYVVMFLAALMAVLMCSLSVLDKSSCPSVGLVSCAH